MSKRDTREAFYSVKYSAITDCYYSKSYPKLDIMGDMQYKKHRYNAQRQLEDKVFREGFLKDVGFFILLLSSTVIADFVHEVEMHAPIKVRGGYNGYIKGVNIE